MDIKESNRLIAEFMGWECKTRKNYHDKILVLYKPNGSIFKYSGYSYLFNDNPWDAPLKFHSSWDWLMPVLIKIGLIDDGYGWKLRLYSGCEDSFALLKIRKGVHDKFIFSPDDEEVFFNGIPKYDGSEPVIDTVYRGVVKFIKWHNANKKE